MKEHNTGKIKIIITFAVLFLIVSVLLLLIFYAGKKSYTVTFDLNGGTLLGGSLEQTVTQGQSATPPTAYKDGAYLRGWSAPYNQITKNIVITAIWEYETTPGIIYSSSSNQNFTKVIGAYEYIRGDVYLGAYYGDKKVLGIDNGAFAGHSAITRVYLLDGLINIGNDAFAGCTAITAMEIPRTVTHIGNGAFRNCASMEALVLKEGLLEIGEGAFENCSALKEIVIPSTVTTIGADAFDGCDDLVIIVSCAKWEKPEGWADGWQGSAGVIWTSSDGIAETETEPETEINTEPESDTNNETETEEGITFPIFRPIIRPIFTGTEESDVTESEEKAESTEADSTCTECEATDSGSDLPEIDGEKESISPILDYIRPSKGELDISEILDKNKIDIDFSDMVRPIKPGLEADKDDVTDTKTEAFTETESDPVEDEGK